jgi:hypothetical protein
MSSTTTRLGLYKSASDGSELVNYTQDIGQNLDALDLAAGFQSCTSSTRPSAPYSGKPIFQSDTSYSTYFSNGTSPASASWVEIPNSSASYGNNLNMAANKQVNIGGSGSGASFAALNPLTSSDLLSGRVTGDTASRIVIDTDGTMGWGPGGSTATDTNLARTATGRLALTGTNAALLIGTAAIRPLAAATVTVANTTTETAIGTFTIPANDTAVGAVYRLVAFGTASVTATPTFTIRGRLGGAAGTLAATVGPVTASTGVTNQMWTAEFDIVCLTTGASGTWMPRLVCAQNVSVATVQTGTFLLPTTGASVTRDTTVSSDMVLTWAWSAASASNTATARAFAYRIA